MQSETHTIVLKGYAPEPSTATAEIARYSTNERLRRALVGLGVTWLIGVVCAFIPIAHLILVPGAFVAGIVIFFARLRVDRRALRVEGPCPDCGAAQTFETHGRWQLPQDVVCGSCHRRLVLERER